MGFVQKIEAMSRGVVVLDNNIESLESHLQKRNIKVIVPPSGMQDEHIIEKLLPFRIFITNNVRHFTQDATSFEYGIIEVPMNLMADPAKASKAISDAIMEHSLWSRSHAFLVTINNIGKSSFKILKD